MTQKTLTDNIIYLTVQCPRCGIYWTYPKDEKEPMPSPEELCPTCVYDSVNEINPMGLNNESKTESI